MEFIQKLENYTFEINKYLYSLFEEKKEDIYESIRYSLYNGGKRVRPILSIAVAEAFGGDKHAATVFGCAIEMIHTYSLIHDDLPCMDNDDLRRGKPTSHKVFGEATAVLTGDALLNYSCESILQSNLSSDLIVQAMSSIYSAAGSDGMIGGQMIDMYAENNIIDNKTLELLHRKKTGALINSAVEIGAISSGKPKDILKDFSSSLGLAFQIKDDILDVEGDEAKVGKPINSDKKNNKCTFVTAYGIDGAKEKLRCATEKAVSSLEILEEKGDFLKEYAYFLLSREY